MADLFTLTAPLLIRFPDNTRHVMVACFRHPNGILYFRPFWNQLRDGEGIQLATGDIKGEGPWKVGDAVVTVLGCQGTDPEQAAEFSDWNFILSSAVSSIRHGMNCKQLRQRKDSCLPCRSASQARSN